MRRGTAVLILAAFALVLAACGGGHGGRTAQPTTSAPSPVTPRPTTTASSPHSAPLTGAHLRPGSDPSVLPGPVLIADSENNRLLVVDPHGRVRWQFPGRGDLAPGQTFRLPDDAFFTTDGRRIIATQEEDFVVSVIDPTRGRIVYRYGTPGVPGSGPNHLWNPDDAMLLPGGWILTADIKNCRLLLIREGAHRPARAWGSPAAGCVHDPPRSWGSPNGAFPMRNGDFLVDEINGDWVDEFTLQGRVIRSWHPPGITYPSDTNEIHPGVYLTVGYTRPGVLETFDRHGRLLWRYRPRPGQPQLNHPSLALPLPNRDFLLNDDYNDRVIVIDPHTDRVVWQYGHTATPGRAPGYLSDPDGVDLVPPHSLLIRHAATIGHP